MRIRLHLFAGAVPLLPLALVSVPASAQTHHAPAHADEHAGTWTFHHEHVLGTSLELRVRADTHAAAVRAETAALAEIDRQDRILSAWRPDSEFSRWERTRFEPVSVSPELYSVLEQFDDWRLKTGGALDASAEAAIRLWRRARADGRTPDAHETAAAVEAMQQPHWRLDATHRTATRLSDAPLALATFAKSIISAQAADLALQAGARGVMLNVGGDVVTRGTLQQSVQIADPRAASENDGPLDHVVVSDCAVATSGSYRRDIELATSSALRRPEFSHIVDPRTGRPTGHILSSTVIAHDAATAGALATAFSVLNPDESATLAAATPDVAYLLVTADGRLIQSANWPKYQVPGMRPVVYAPVAAPSAMSTGQWNPAFDLSVALELPRIDDARYRRPYVAVWIEDADHFPVRTLALWTQNPRWLPELKQWYRDDQIRNLSEGTDISKTISSATRPPGHYTLRWDGKDNEGKLVKAGKYTVVVEASREHGGYQLDRQELTFDAKTEQATLAPGKELGAVSLDYSKR